MYSRASEPWPRTSPGFSRLTSRPRTAGDPRAQHRHQPRPGWRPASWPLQRGAPHALDLVALDVDQEHVGAAAIRAERELGDQVALQRADAEDEEAAEADREQDHARLVAGTPQADDRMPQRKPRRRRERQRRAGRGRTRRRTAPPRRAANPALTAAPARQRSGLPRGDRDERAADDDRGADLQPVDRARQPTARRREPAPPALAAARGLPGRRRRESAAAA